MRVRPVSSLFFLILCVSASCVRLAGAPTAVEHALGAVYRGPYEDEQENASWFSHLRAAVRSGDQNAACSMLSGVNLLRAAEFGFSADGRRINQGRRAMGESAEARTLVAALAEHSTARCNESILRCLMAANAPVAASDVVFFAGQGCQANAAISFVALADAERLSAMAQFTEHLRKEAADPGGSEERRHELFYLWTQHYTNQSRAVAGAASPNDKNGEFAALCHTADAASLAVLSTYAAEARTFLSASQDRCPQNVVASAFCDKRQDLLSVTTSFDDWRKQSRDALLAERSLAYLGTASATCFWSARADELIVRRSTEQLRIKKIRSPNLTEYQRLDRMAAAATTRLAQSTERFAQIEARAWSAGRDCKPLWSD